MAKQRKTKIKDRAQFAEEVHGVISRNIRAKPKAFIDEEGRIKQTVVFTLGDIDNDLDALGARLGLAAPKPQEVIDAEKASE